MSERLTALGMGVLVSWFLFLAVHSVSLADESSREQSAGSAKTRVKAPLENVTASESPSAPEKKGDASSVARIRAALDRPVVVEFIETPLEDFVASLRKYQIPVLIDRRSLDEMGIGPDVPVTRCVKGVRLAKLLDLVLGDLDLTWVIRDEVLLITHEETASHMLETRVLNAADLAGGDKEIDQLAALIQTVIVPTTWDAVGGPASIGCMKTSEIRALVISQTRTAHDEIAQLITDLRSGLAGTPDKPRSPVSASAARIQEVLAEKTTVNFVETPLADVIAQMGEKHRIEIQLDHRSLGEMGIRADEPITFSLSGVSMESTLNLLLRDLDLTFMIKDDVLLILHSETEQNQLQVRVHRVDDLVDAAPKELEMLAALIRSNLVPTTWDEVGGPASIAPYENAGLEVLIVSQTWRVHREIERLLDGLRSARPQ